MSSILCKIVERNLQRMSITGTQGWMWLRTKNNDKGICNRGPLSSNYGTFVILMRSTDPATAGPKYLVTSRLLLEDAAMVFHAPLVATWSSNACHTRTHKPRSHKTAIMPMIGQGKTRADQRWVFPCDFNFFNFLRGTEIQDHVHSRTGVESRSPIRLRVSINRIGRRMLRT